MDASDYLDWRRHSGTGLGAIFPGDKYEQLHEELSSIGANVVIVGEFLDANADLIDVNRWRQYEVLGMGQPAQRKQIALTSAALEAIGATNTAKAVLSAKAPFAGLPPLADLAAGAPVDEDALRQAADMIRGQAMAMFPEMVDELPEDVRKKMEEGIPRPQQTAGVESPKELRELLDRYVADHQEELTADLARHGDPRTSPDFDPERHLDELDDESERLTWVHRQEGDLPRLQKKLERFARLAASEPESAHVRSAREDLMEEYRFYEHHDPQNLTAEIQTWLREVKRIRSGRAGALSLNPTHDERINSQLAAIGEFEIDSFDGQPRIEWPKPVGLECEWASLKLVFYLFFEEKEPGPDALVEAYGKLLDAWNRFRDNFPDIVSHLRQQIVDDFRQYSADQLWEEDRADFEDENGVITDERILANLEGGAVGFGYDESGEVSISAAFGASWDPEHGVEIELGTADDIGRRL